MTEIASTVRIMDDQFSTYETFRDWLTASYPEDSSTTVKGSTFRDFVARLLPESARGHRFGPLIPNPKQSHDLGVDVLSADTESDQFALQTKFSIYEKKDLDEIVSKFNNYESTLDERPDGRLFSDEGPTAPRPVYGIATASRIKGVLKAYKDSKLASRTFYDQLIAEDRLLIWDGDDLRDDARQLNARHFQLPLELELSSIAGGWLRDGDVWLGVVEGVDLVRLEAEHGPGLFYENVRGWLGLEGGRDGETVNQAIRKTISDEPDQMLARNNGVTFRATEVVVEEGSTTLQLRDASIINGRQTTGALSTVDGVHPRCRVQVKVVQAARDAWAIADAANNQNRVARIELLLARYFRDQVVKREMAAAVSGSDWLETVVDEDRIRQELFELLRALLIGIFCQKPGQLAENNYSHIRWDVLDAFYQDGEPPAILYPTLFEVAKATNDAVDIASQMGDVDPLEQIGEQGRPKYRAFLALLTVAATNDIDLSTPLDDVASEVDRIERFLAGASELLEGDPDRFTRNFSLAYEIVGFQAQGAEEGDPVKVQQRLSQSVFGTAFTTHFKRTRQAITSDARRRELLP